MSTCIFYRSERRSSELVGLLLLAFVWCSGLCIGYSLYLHTADLFYSLMCTAPLVRVSIVGLIFVVYLPFLASVLALCCYADPVIYIIAFLKSLIYAFCACHIVVTFSSAGWIVRFLLLFSDASLMIPLFWFWCRRICFKQRLLMQDSLFYLSISLVVTIVDYFVIARFTQMLFL